MTRKAIHIPASAARRTAPLLQRRTRDQAAERQNILRRRRIGVTAAVFLCCFGVVGAKLAEVMLMRAEARMPQPRIAASETEQRRPIVDRNGQLLAADAPTISLYANRSEIIDPDEVATGLAGVFPHLDRDALARMLARPGDFVWVVRHITPQERAAVHALGQPGLHFERDRRRFYPNQATAAHVLGHVGFNNVGKGGLEFSRSGRIVMRDADDGAPLMLSLDLRVQHALEDELQRSLERFQAIGAAGIVLDVETGEVIALASLPDFDPNQAAGAGADALFNRTTSARYEMGSTFKAFTVAMALEDGLATLDSRFDATKPLRIGRFQIRDFRGKNRWLTTREVFKYSSNIGSARMAALAGADRQRAFLSDLGLLSRPEFELADVDAPIVPARWGEATVATVSYGHGLSVNALQLASAMAAMVNGGIYRPATLFAGQRNEGRRVISPAVSADMRALFREVVAEGTARSADVPGYPVGGKTGTAEKPKAGSYSRSAIISSFVGVFPAMTPRYLVFVMLDEPKPTADTHGFATGGWTAAPTVGNVVRRIGPLLNVPPEPVAGAGDAAE